MIDCVDAAISDLAFTFDNPDATVGSLNILVEGVDIIDGYLQSKCVGEDGLRSMVIYQR